jgi:hypothetical protein
VTRPTICSPTPPWVALRQVANFRYLRWENIVVILHTKGKVIVPDDLNTILIKSDDKKISEDKKKNGLKRCLGSFIEFS